MTRLFTLAPLGAIFQMTSTFSDLIRSIATPGDPRSPTFSDDDIINKRNLEKIQNYYASCMDEARLVEIGRQPLISEIKKLIQIYNVHGSDLAMYSSKKGATLLENDIHALSAVIGQYLKNGIDTVFKFLIDAHGTDTRHYNIRIENSGLGLTGKDPYNDTHMVEPYEKQIGEMFTLILGSQDNAGDIKVPEIWTKVAKNVVAFEAALSRIAIETNANSDLQVRVHSIADLTERTPSLDWSVIFGNAFPEDVKAPSNVYLNAPEYFSKLNALLESTSPKTLQNYFAWTLIRTYGINLGKTYRKPLDDFSRVSQGVLSLPDRSAVCVGSISTNLADLVGHYFVAATFTDATANKIHEIIDGLREAYTENFKIYDWFDSFTRKGALEKVKAILEIVGYSKGNPNDGDISSVDAYYRNLEIRPDDYFGNQAKSLTFLAQSRFQLLNTPATRESMFLSPQTADAFYESNLNVISIPAGILRAPFYHIDNPEYLNYGAIGMAVGHEIGHGFDNHGRSYDSTGSLRDWWSNSSAAAYVAKSQCIIEEYGNFTIKGPNNQDFHLDEQMFFVQYGHIWCTKERPETYKKALQNVHSPGKWRINGVVRNSEFFAQAFKCNPGTPMNPVNKCSVL
ncbi:Endothelin-converting enzyme 1 [Entomortierella chlamydospora]|uniref:Endothelin-converting enzyme 1 n=1 Tax=Entomortierella chlamydospora TaxID=101097 RepID=A0A9P6N007_9FUNG|nr:Endothelin-converting enzyme 1 [Entomortierella chlamydospora]